MKRAPRWLLTTLVLCIGVSLGGFDAKAADSKSPVDAILAVPTFWISPAPRKVRLEQAQRFLTMFTRLLDAIPTLSPREEQWVTTEYTAAIAATWEDPKKRSYSRLMRVQDNREYNIKHGRSWADNVVAALKSIIEFDGDRELIAWTSLAMYLTATDGPQHVWWLQEHEVIAKTDLPVDVSSRESYVGTMVGWGNIILQNVVLPIEDGRLPRGAR